MSFTKRCPSLARFVDAWRDAFPDEIGKPGFTWTPLTKPDNPNDHHDRIDFIYFRGMGVARNGVAVVGEDREHADVVVAPYPSDHRAVVASFTLAHDGAVGDGASLHPSSARLAGSR